MTTTSRVLLVSGSLRATSTNSALLRTARRSHQTGSRLSYTEDSEPFPTSTRTTIPKPSRRPLASYALRSGMRTALSSRSPSTPVRCPARSRTLLDWTIGDDQPGSIYEKPVAWINASPRGAVNAHEQLRLVLGYAHATIIEAACTQVSVTPAMINNDGLIADTAIREEIAKALTILASIPGRGDKGHLV